MIPALNSDRYIGYLSKITEKNVFKHETLKIFPIKSRMRSVLTLTILIQLRLVGTRLEK